MPAALNAHEAGIRVIANRFTSRNLRFGLFGTEPFINELNDLLLRETGVLQPADLGARQGRQSLDATFHDGLEGGVRKADELQSHGFTAENVHLIGLRHGQDLLVRVARARQFDGGVRAAEFVLVIVRRLEQREAEVIGRARLLQFREL